MANLYSSQLFNKSITASDGSGYITILNFATNTKLAPYKAKRSTGWNVEIQVILEDVLLTYALPSFPESPIPPIFPEDSQAERLKKFIDNQKGYPNVGLEIYFDLNDGNGWVYRSQILLHNYGPTTNPVEAAIPCLNPYISTANVALLPEDMKLGCKVVNKGHGALGAGDYLIFTGYYQLHISIVPDRPELALF